MPDRPRKSPVVPLVVAVVAALVLLGLAFGSTVGGSPAPEDAAPTTGPTRTGPPPADNGLAQLARRDAEDPLARGDPDAPVVMIMYSDFQCPFCGKFARDTLPQLEQKYVDNGTLRLEWRDFPYLGPESSTASRAARAAAEQDRFWEFHDALYADQPRPNSGRLDDRYLESVAETAGLDVAAFRAAVESGAGQQAVDADFREGQSIGVSGTPSFLINGRPIIGAQPVEVFEQAIEDAARAS